MSKSIPFAPSTAMQEIYQAEKQEKKVLLNTCLALQKRKKQLKD